MLPRSIGFTCCALALMTLSGPALAQIDNVCDPGESPDVIVGSLHQERRNGELNGITAFSIGTTSCNVGGCGLQWIDDTSEHPVIGGNMFRMKDGRFEQIGQSWLKHGFFALSQGLCSAQCISTNGTQLGVNCSDPYSSFLNGQQSGLGPRSEVNASTGGFPYPFSTIGQTGDAIFKRLQVHNDDLDPAKNAGAEYFVEGHYITADDAAANNATNNASYRSITVSGSGSFFDINLTGSTQRERPAIFAWRGADPTVKMRKLQIQNDGLLYVASKASNNGDGTWTYEYAIHNLNSHRSVGSLTVPIPSGATITNTGFHDVDYHSGEVYAGTDWGAEVNPPDSPFSIRWATDTFADDPNANALRWGTLYNFRFDADVAPNAGGDVFVGLFRPGTPEAVIGFAFAPLACDNDGICDPSETCDTCPSDCVTAGGQGGAACCGDGFCDPVESSCTCSADCGLPLAEEFVCNNGADDDCDGLTDCADGDCCADGACETGIDNDGDLVANCDCDDANSQVWERPGEVQDLLLTGGPGDTELDWALPTNLGGLQVTFSTIRSDSAGDFLTGSVCLPSAIPSDTRNVDASIPKVGQIFNYLIRAENACPAAAGQGDLGPGPDGSQREAISCP